jgi:hypothetical protein
VAYDADDTTQAFHVVGAAGVVAAPSVNITSLNANAKTGNPEYKVNYTPSSYSMTPSNYLNYVRSRKEFKSISTLSDITTSGIYLFDNDTGTLDLNSVPAQFNQYDVVLMMEGVVNIDMANFNPTRSIAFVSEAITFSSSSAQATGLFIADVIETGTTTNQGLKINGNLVAQTSLVNGRKWTNQKIPTVFVVFKPDIYLDLLPYLSIANYEWKQLQ